MGEDTFIYNTNPRGFS